MTNVQWDMLSFELGTVAIITRSDSIIRVCFVASPDAALALVKALYPEAKQSSQPMTDEALKQLSEYFHGKRRTFNVSLGQELLSPFACRVHQALSKVPYGSVVTYGELAALAGSPKAARAVGRVMSSNPFPLLVPCHRVVNADGTIGQYSAAQGHKTKTCLIGHERKLTRA